ncbi:MAG: 3-hydroxyacyl-CoA dehydrogenase family protein [Candidatus Methanoperedens sp.]|nr:3-hydroxyacyl-CoA dehydrogenase family protein [Candidatus Methanoperedens sp.]MCZ7369982.1 3-hydroxyacyl-CoA dehydrogenase family protein [Candidatus Methanoperedens sp.]
MEIKKIGVIGAGTMGGGIAQAAGQSGYEVVMEDVSEEYVSAGFARIKERLEKRVVEGKLERIEKDRIISNIKTIANLEDCKDADLNRGCCRKRGCKKADFQRIGYHMRKRNYFHYKYLFHIDHTACSGYREKREVRRYAFHEPGVRDEARRSGYDSPGFVSNRVLMPMINDALYCLHEGIASRESIDSIMKLGANHPMGPLELADLVGLDICLDKLEVLHGDLGEVQAMSTASKNGRGWKAWEKNRRRIL